MTALATSPVHAVAHQSAAAAAQGRCGKILEVHRDCRTESEILPIESEVDSSVNSESGYREGGRIIVGRRCLRSGGACRTHLPPIEQVLRGTLVEAYKRCGRPNCHCVDGPGHGPKRYLSISQPGGRPRRDYVPNGVHMQVAQLIDNFRKLREMLNEICAINAELLRRREELG
jgi:hypothetical protein